jgi:hypothetical protein
MLLSQQQRRHHPVQVRQPVLLRQRLQLQQVQVQARRQHLQVLPCKSDIII